MKALELRCFKFFFDAFLPPASAGENYYEILGVNHRAKADEIRRAYRRRAVKCHPDKKQQRDGVSSSVDAQEFKRLHEAYETLMDPEKRRMLDMLGSKGMLYVSNPRSISFQEVVSNLSKAPCWKRTKFAVLVSVISFFILMQPILVCINIDKTSKHNESFAVNPYWPWAAVLAPLWIFNVIFLAWFVSQYLANRNDNDDDDNNEEDEDSTRRRRHKAKHSREHTQRQLSLISRTFQFLLIILTEIFLSLKLDGVVNFKYSQVFIPLYVHQFLLIIQLIRSIIRSRSDINRMVTVRYLEREVLKRPFADLTDDEKRVVNEAFIIVQTPIINSDDEEQQEEEHQTTSNQGIEESEEFRQVQQIALESQKKILYFPFRAVFIGLLIPQLDNTSFSLNWWLVFLPLWVAISCSCCSIIFIYVDALQMVKVEKSDKEHLSDHSADAAPHGGLTQDDDEKDCHNPNDGVQPTENKGILNLVKAEEEKCDDLHTVGNAHISVQIQTSSSQMEEGNMIPMTNETLPIQLLESSESNFLSGEDLEERKVLPDLSTPITNEKKQISKKLDSNLFKDADPLTTMRIETLLCQIPESSEINSSKDEDLEEGELSPNLSSPIESCQIPESSKSLQDNDLEASKKLPDQSTPIRSEASQIPKSSDSVKEKDLEEGNVLPSEDGIEDDDDDSVEYFMMMDEDSSRDASRMAWERCCHLIWLITISCLFVGKLQGGGYSALWIIFPILLFAGCFLSSVCCLIYCSTADGSVPETSEMDAQHHEETSSHTSEKRPSTDTKQNASPPTTEPDQVLSKQISVTPPSGEQSNASIPQPSVHQESDISDID